MLHRASLSNALPTNPAPPSCLALKQRASPVLPSRLLHHLTFNHTPHPIAIEVKAQARKQDRSNAKTFEADVDFTEQRPFFEPVIRSFALGLGTGILLELLHVTITISKEASLNATSVSSLLPQVLQLDELNPLMFWDNFVAMAGFATSYGLEVAAIVAVLKQFPNDSRKATHAIMRMPTIPKLLMPNLPNLRRALYNLITHKRTPTPTLSASTATASPSSACALPPSASDPPSATATTTATAPQTKGPAVQAPQTSSFVDGDKGRGGPFDGNVLEQPGTRGVPFPPLQGPSLPTPKPTPRSGLAPGAWAPTEQMPSTLKRARELQQRRGFLKNFWYCVALSQQLGQDEPLEVAILGRKVALFRDAEGKPHCLDNVCPHRGAPLGQGWVKDVPSPVGKNMHSCVVCPYHGWAFDTEGKLREVPSSPDQMHLPKRSLVPSYPVEEKGGFVWLFFGSSAMPPEERPPIPYVPELEDPKWQPVYGELEFNAPHWSVFDNAIDMAHIHYLHGDSFGNESKPEVMDMQVKSDTFSTSGTFRIHNKPVNALWEWTSRDSVPVEVTAFLPSTSSIKITLGQGVQMITFVNTVPIDADRSINRFCLIRNFAGWSKFDVWACNAMFKILGEDKKMVEQLRPEHVRAEVSLGADLPQVAFRQLRSEWAAMGYIAEPGTLQGFEGSLDQ